MKDIAALAGVSITTVSHVVNDTRVVSESTRSRVLEAVARTGYTGDAIARSLVTGTGTRSLGVAISLVANPYFAELIKAIEGAASAAGHTLLLVDTHDEAHTEADAVRMLKARRVDGLLLLPSRASTVLPELPRLGLPVVLVDRIPDDSPFDCIGPENVESMATLVQHLAERGHRRIGLVRGASGFSTSTERVNGYRLGLERAGLPWDPKLVASGKSVSKLGATALHRLLDLPKPPTAVVAANNAMLVGVLHAVRERKLRIGKDLAVVGYDDVEWADLVEPPITTMAQPIREIGRTAVRMLLERIEDPTTPPQIVRLPPVFMHRQSCGCS
ncbi:LacI family transcriptional regulator [Pendulispora brunnea]|uniref:LacI family transcriptional regulator n=1 Tax=Pendulispora brunnea TaxID=2905690 RepID=A0ABZ2KLA0_9BACT